MVKKSSLKDKNKFSFFYKLFHIFPLPLRKKTKPLTFSALFDTENRKTARENVPSKFFFSCFSLLFCIVPLLVIGKITTFLFFSKFRFKVPKTDAKGAQVSFFSNYLFSPRDYANTYTYPHTLRFSDP